MRNPIAKDIKLFTNIREKMELSFMSVLNWDQYRKMSRQETAYIPKITHS